MKAFASMVPANARAITATSQKAGVNAFTFHGVWQGRRFLLQTITVPKLIPTISVTKDLDNGTLTLTKECLSDPSSILSAMRSFGAAVARHRQRNGSFEIAEGFDRELHHVPAFHHVALCGHKGPWPDNVHEGIPVTCPSCAKIAATKPQYRARYHPMAAGNTEG